MISISVPELGSWEGNIFFGILGFSWATYLWEEYLAFRQRRVYIKNIDPPKECLQVTDKETYEKARIYGLDRSKFSLIKGCFDQVLNTGFMICGGLPYFWDMSGQLVQWLGYEGVSEIPQTIAFVSVGSLINSILAIPWSVYYTFYIEQKHGFNKQTPAFYTKDTIKKFFVAQLIIAPIISGIVYIVQQGSDYFFLYLFGFSTLVMLFLMTVYPDYIAPLFDKYEPLPEGELKTRIEELAASLKYPLTKVYIVEGSKRSAHSNAYLYGFYKNKRIVLYDTLIEDYTPLNKEEETTEGKEDKPKKKTGCNNDEIMAVLGHELGHWKLSHVLKGLVISEGNMFLMYMLFQSMFRYKPIFGAYGFNNTQPALISLIIVMQFVMAPYSELLGFLLTIFSRHNEFQADEFACQLNKGEMLKSALIKLNNDNLSFPVYDPLYSTWHHSHPPVLERLRTIDKHMKKKE